MGKKSELYRSGILPGSVRKLPEAVTSVIEYACAVKELAACVEVTVEDSSPHRGLFGGLFSPSYLQIKGRLGSVSEIFNRPVVGSGDCVAAWEDELREDCARSFLAFHGVSDPLEDSFIKRTTLMRPKKLVVRAQRKG
jgi:hypothetical protein